MKKINEHVKNLSFFTLILVLSPLVDLGISIIHVHSPNVSFLGSAIRGFLLVGVLFYSFFIRKECNKKMLYYLVVLLSFMSLFIVYKNFAVQEIIGALKFFFFPIMLGCFLMHKENSEKVKNSIYIGGIIYMLLLIIPLLTGTAFKTYEYIKSGFVGWFRSPNEISAIVSLIFPFIVIKVFESKDHKHKIGALMLTMIYIYAILSIGTKVPFFAVLITLILFLIVFLIQLFIYKNKSVITNTILVAVLIGLSIFTSAKGLLLNNVLLQNGSYDNSNSVNKPEIPTQNPDKPSTPVVPVDPVIPNVPNQEPEKPPVGAPEIKPPAVDLGDNYSQLLQEYFGTIENEPDEEYQTNKFINLIFSSRDIYLMRKLRIWNNSYLMEKLLGNGFVYTYNNNVTNKLVEIDFIDVFFCYGIVGFILYYIIIIFVLWRVLKCFFNNFKKIISNITSCAYYISVGLAVLISCFSGHILGAPAVSLLFAIVISTLHNEGSLIKLEKWNFFKFKRLFVIGVPLIIMLSFTFVIRHNLNKNAYTIDLTYKNAKLTLKSWVKDIELIDEKTIESDYAKDNLKLYVISDKGEKIAKVLMVTRSIDEDTTFHFFTGQNISDKEYEITIKNKNKVNKITSFSEYEIVKEFSTTVGYDKRTLPSLYAEGKKSSLLFYKTYIYDIMKKEYDSNNYSILKNLMSEENTVKQKGKKVYNQFILSQDQMFDALVIENKNKIFNTEEEMLSFVDIINTAKSSSWLSFDGPYIKLPYSIEPYTKEGYGRNIGSVIEKEMYRLFSRSNNDFFEAYVMSSLHTFAKYLPRNSSGIWLTEYTSTWLKKDYEIKAVYVDTRHNDTIANFFDVLAEDYNDNKLKTWSHYYAGYLLYEYEKGNVNTLKEGKLAPDYFSTHHNINTHTSLNHQLSIINYLFRVYIDTNKDEYRNLALEYLKTVEKIGTRWIKDNNDLYYQIDSKGKVGKDDCVTLTFEDLLTTQNLLEDIGMSRSKSLDKLIVSKYKYLKSIKYNLSSFTIDLLKEGGYIE